MEGDKVFLIGFILFWVVVFIWFEIDEWRLAKSLKVGDKVIYIPTGEKGIVKSIKGKTAFVVYNCDDMWRSYYNYTAKGTSISSLKKGWDVHSNS